MSEFLFTLTNIEKPSLSAAIKVKDIELRDSRAPDLFRSAGRILLENLREKEGNLIKGE